MTVGLNIDRATDHPLHAVINPPMPPVQELSKLRLLLNSAAEEAERNLQDNAQAVISLELSGIKNVLAGQAFPDAGESGVSGLLHAADWGTHLVVQVPHEGIDMLVDALFGGDGSEASLSSDCRLSLIRNSAAGFLLALFAQGLEFALASRLPTPVRLQRLDQHIQFEEIGGETAPVVAATCTLTIFERPHDIVLAVPESAIVPFRAMFEASGADVERLDGGAWQQRMRAEISRLLVPLRTVLDESAMPLIDLANLRSGAILPLKATTASLATMECGGRPVFRGRLDDASGLYTIHIEECIGAQTSAQTSAQTGAQTGA